MALGGLHGVPWGTVLFEACGAWWAAWCALGHCALRSVEGLHGTATCACQACSRVTHTHSLSVHTHSVSIYVAGVWLHRLLQPMLRHACLWKLGHHVVGILPCLFFIN